MDEQLSLFGEPEKKVKPARNIEVVITVFYYACRHLSWHKETVFWFDINSDKGLIRKGWHRDPQNHPRHFWTTSYDCCPTCQAKNEGQLPVNK